MKKEIPQHIAIIMDGNRRWAKNRGLPLPFGHQKGYETFQKIADACLVRGIKYLTVYAFSTENWKRPKREIKILLRLLEQALKKEFKKLQKKKIRLRILGSIERFPKTFQKLIKETTESTSNNTRGVLNVALNYGGRAELINAFKKIIKKNPRKITEEDIEENLYTAGEPDPDLIIRTGGVTRLSNFLLWQASYSELYFTNTLWPDFTEHELDLALKEYSFRKRNFGK